MSARQAHPTTETQLHELMTHRPITISPAATLRDVAQLLAERHIGGVPVVADQTVVGVVSATDVLEFITGSPRAPADEDSDVEGWSGWEADTPWEENEDTPHPYFLEWEGAGPSGLGKLQEFGDSEWDVLAEHTVEEAMTRTVCWLPPASSVGAAARYMLDAGVHRILVMEDGRLIGIFTTTDIVRAVAERGI